MNRQELYEDFKKRTDFPVTVQGYFARLDTYKRWVLGTILREKQGVTEEQIRGLVGPRGIDGWLPTVLNEAIKEGKVLKFPRPDGEYIYTWKHQEATTAVLPDIALAAHIGATHYAVLPDDSTVYYKLGDTLNIWLPGCRIWAPPGLVPYTLHCLEGEG